MLNKSRFVKSNLIKKFAAEQIVFELYVFPIYCRRHGNGSLPGLVVSAAPRGYCESVQGFN
jgi:hypothetical protein